MTWRSRRRSHGDDESARAAAVGDGAEEKRRKQFFLFFFWVPYCSIVKGDKRSRERRTETMTFLTAAWVEPTQSNEPIIGGVEPTNWAELEITCRSSPK
jgi:hypothetical protein